MRETYYTALSSGGSALAEQDGEARASRTWSGPGRSCVVQVVKEPGGQPRARASPCHVTLPGRLTGASAHGQAMSAYPDASTDDGERERLHGASREASCGAGGMGIIVRTAAEGASAEALREDYRRRCARSAADHCQRRRTCRTAPALLHCDGSLARSAPCATCSATKRTNACAWTEGACFQEAFWQTRGRSRRPCGSRGRTYGRAESPLFDRFCGVDSSAEKRLRPAAYGSKAAATLVFD